MNKISPKLYMSAQLPVVGSNVLLQLDKVMGSLPVTPMEHPQFGISTRPPASSYAVSIDELIQQIDRLLDCHDRVLSAPRDGDDIAVINNDMGIAVRSVIGQMDEHIESCQMILKGLRDIGKCNKGAKSIDSQFLEMIREYRDYVSERSNHIKHRQGRVRITSVRDMNYTTVLGFHIESISHDGAVGPHPKYHEDGKYIDSLNRQVRLWCIGVIFIANALASVLKRNGFADSEQTVVSNASLLKLLRRVSALPAIMLPNEMLKPWPHISVMRKFDGSGEYIQIDFPGPTQSVIAIGGSLTVNAFWKGDGQSKVFQLPFV